MAQLMKTAETPPELRWQRGKMLPVKREVKLENSADEELCPLNKRSKLPYSLQQQLGVGAGGFLVSPLQDGPLDEPSPLGLRLRKSPSLLDLIQMRLSQSSTAKEGSHGKKVQKGSTGLTEKLKASNFPASVLRIGSWEYKSRYEGDLVAKCYFAKHKLVWEVLDGGLKNKIEIQWSDIMGLKANYPDDAPGTLDVVLARQPLFFRETNPQPRKHTLWQATSDFTEGQASVHRRHYLQCPQGLLGKHFEKLMQCDPRLNFLSHQAEIKSDSPYFESRLSVFEDPHVTDREFDLNDDGSPNFLDLQSTTSPSGAHCSKSKSEQDPVGRPLECIHQEKLSPNLGATEDIKSREVEQQKGLSDLNQLRVPGMHPSVSMSDLVSHLEQRVSEQKTSKGINLASDERQSLEILEEISKSLLSDTQNVPASDEKSLMSRVNSLCCLLQKDPATAQKSENCGDVVPGGKRVNEINFIPTAPFEREVEDDPSTSEDESNDFSSCKPAPTMSRKDSVGNLLLNLPRIASLPQFLFICEDTGNQAR
ncbi:uncharacterized protein LOC107760261 isoform X1 [Nicotiana tabacum]|uniref:Uncharacterized protein LOC107760261 isoform X1 n=1 Tax=Nicotiana tabacum TaxID=4097 RepID=A0A1S3X1A4_TOBAC|nr:PREDICTED: uncharacterized protein LOC107760261 isoform X1 [Nicotiana tabacum]